MNLNKSILKSRPEIPVTPGLFKELPFFKMEPVFIIAVLFISMVLASLELLGLIEFGVLYAYILSIGSMFIIWLTKFLLYMPRGKKIFIEKVYDDNTVQLIISKQPKDNKVNYSKNNLEIPPTRIERYHKHIEYYTGKPYVKTIQGKDLNYSVNELLEEKSDKSAQEVETLIAKADAAAYLRGIGIALKMQDPLKNPQSIILLVAIVLLLFMIGVGVLDYSQTGEILALIQPK